MPAQRHLALLAACREMLWCRLQRPWQRSQPLEAEGIDIHLQVDDVERAHSVTVKKIATSATHEALDETSVKSSALKTIVERQEACIYYLRVFKLYIAISALLVQHDNVAFLNAVLLARLYIVYGPD